MRAEVMQRLGYVTDATLIRLRKLAKERNSFFTSLYCNIVAAHPVKCSTQAIQSPS
jgi:hypothetical protein